MVQVSRSYYSPARLDMAENEKLTITQKVFFFLTCPNESNTAKKDLPEYQKEIHVLCRKSVEFIAEVIIKSPSLAR